MSTKRDLVRIKSSLGEIQLLDYRGLDLGSAHYKLGVEVGSQCRKILKNKLLRVTKQQFVEQVRGARLCETALKIRLLSSLPASQILRAYFECLNSWSDGANLLQTDHEYIKTFPELTNLNLGLLLQNENVGCQTGVYRLKTGNVLGWHTEEEVEEEFAARFDKLRIAIFSHRNADVYAFIYPDLMPGPAYCWRNDLFIQMVDSLFLKYVPDAEAIPANIATWVNLFAGRLMRPDEIPKQLAPFIDGYSLTTVCSANSQVHAEKVEFGRDRISISNLNTEVNDYLFQVNMISDPSSELAQLEDLTSMQKKKYQKRIMRTHQMIDRVRESGDIIPAFLEILCTRSTRDGEMGYSNKDVKSYLLFTMSAQDLHIWCGTGPAMKKDTPIMLSFTSEG